MNTIYLHPMIVHFPIALLTIGAIAALVAKFLGDKPLAQTLFKYAAISVIVGAVAGLGAIGSGYMFTEAMVGVMAKIRETHILLAFASVACGAIAAVFMALALCPKSNKTQLWQNIALVFSLLTAALVGLTGHYGGVMVFA